MLLRILLCGFLIPSLLIWGGITFGCIKETRDYYKSNTGEIPKFKDWTYNEKKRPLHWTTSSFLLGFAFFFIVSIITGAIISEVDPTPYEYYTVVRNYELISIDETNTTYTYKCWNGNFFEYNYITMNHSDEEPMAKNSSADRTTIVYTTHVPHVEVRDYQFGDWRDWIFLNTTEQRTYLYVPENSVVDFTYLID